MAEQLIGAREIVEKLKKLDRRVGNKLITSALRRSTTPTVRLMRGLALVGTRAHRTYKGRLVTPGFLRRSIKRRVTTNRRSGNKALLFGVRREAWYARFYAQGPTTISQRRGKALKKPYTLPRVPFFSEVFRRDSDSIARRFLDLLRNAARQA